MSRRLELRGALALVCGLGLGSANAGCGGDSGSGDGGSSGTDTDNIDPSGSPSSSTQGSATTSATTETTTGLDTTATDGSSSGTDDTGGPDPGNHIVCDNQIPAAPVGAVCDVTAGDSTLLLQGTVLAGQVVYEHGTVLVDASDTNGRILCAGCDCATRSEADTATVINCAQGVISPALVNPHDHITFSLSQPQGHGAERYDHRHDWREGQNGHTELNVYPGSDSSHEGILYGELRMLLGGATSVTGSVGANNASGLLRNLDASAMTEGLTGVDVDYRTFPLGDAGGQTLTSGCAYPSIDAASHLGNDIYLPHIAEGINAQAHNEFSCMSGAAGGANLIASNTSVIHGIGMRPVDIAVMGQAGAMLVWSPRSNIDLYGITADVTIYRNLGVPIALGTDWSASGSMNPLRELQCADSFNRDHLSEAFSDLELWSMATYWAALSQGAADQIGIIKEGHIADLAIFDGSVHADYRAILEAEPADVALVLRGGQPLHGDAALIEDLVGDTGCEALTMCGVEKRLCVELDTGLSLADIQGAVNSQAYPLFFCGTPDDEPSCDPARQGEFPERGGPDDADGDGVPDGTDNCPDVFNPIRPLDGATQGDADQDGLGNACDLCPLNPGETCRLPDPFDADGDDVPDTEDNCPGASNPDQSDVDGDDVGDACDSCPEISNPGNSPCPVSLYDVKDGTIAEGQAVLIEDVLVTASAPGYGFFVQIHPDDPGFAGAEYSGLFVYQGAASSSPQPGDRVDVSGNVQGFFGQVQLVTSSAPVVLSSDNAPPPPVTASAAALAAGGAQQEALEGVVVRVVDAEVSDIAPPPGAADSEPTGEFEIVGGLRVDDLFYAPNPFPSLGQTFPELLGVARWANGLGKLEPRGQQDYPAVLAAFDAELYFLLEGASAVPTPAMAVGLSHAAAANVTVDLVYGDPSVVSGPASVVVPAGTQSVPLTLTGLAAGSSTVTADDGDNVFVTSVRVYDDAEPRIPTLSPPEATVSLGAQTTLTVDIDLPAPGGGQLVALSAVPGTGITFPPSVTVPAGLLQTSFVVTGGNAATTEEITATIGAASSQTTVNVVDSPAFADLIIVELYHDHTSGDDGFEWVKLYNGTGATLDLSDFSLGWGGTDYTYGTLALAGSVPNGACFLVGGPNGNADSGFPDVVVFDQTGDFDPDIQNSNGAGLADGVALFDVPAGSITAGTVPIDALIYGTDNASGLLDETGGVGVVDAPAAPATDSLQMLSDGTFAVSPSPAPLSCLPLPNP